MIEVVAEGWAKAKGFLMRQKRNYRVAIARPNQVWSTDITYIPLVQGFMYLVAIMDWYSRCVLPRVPALE